MKEKKVLRIAAAFFVVVFVVVLVGVTSSDAGDNRSDVYLALINKRHPLPENWNKRVELITVKNSLNEEVVIEHDAYEAYTLLRNELLKQGVQIELDSAYRSIEDQQETWDWFMKNYGEEYTRGHISPPGFSEHHTGLAIDIFIMKGGKQIRENEEMVEDVEDFEKIHALLPKYGFILRYLPGKKDITGYAPEPWHLRYIGYKNVAKEITEKGVTLEEYLGEN